MISSPTTAASHRAPNFAEFTFRNYPQRGPSDAPRVYLAAMRMAKWGEKGLPGGPWGYATDASEAFRTASPRTGVNKDKREDLGRSRGVRNGTERVREMRLSVLRP